MINYKQVKVYDDLFDSIYIAELANTLQFKISWTIANTANRFTYPYNTKGTHLFLGSQIFFPTTNLKYKKYYFLNNSPLLEPCLGMFNHIQNKLNIDADLHYIGANCQLYGMDGTFHLDGSREDNTYSAVLFISPEYEKSFGGNFIYIENSEEKEIEFKPGRLVVFPGYIPHKGLSFNLPNQPRFSIKWEYNINYEHST